eukprot:scaffold15718_cov107-Isochrysis_galbana.AAC.4
MPVGRECGLRGRRGVKGAERGPPANRQTDLPGVEGDSDPSLAPGGVPRAPATVPPPPTSAPPPPSGLPPPPRARAAAQPQRAPTQPNARPAPIGGRDTRTPQHSQPAPQPKFGPGVKPLLQPRGEAGLELRTAPPALEAGQAPPPVGDGGNLVQAVSGGEVVDPPIGGGAQRGRTSNATGAAGDGGAVGSGGGGHRRRGAPDSERAGQGVGAVTSAPALQEAGCGGRACDSGAPVTEAARRPRIERDRVALGGAGPRVQTQEGGVSRAARPRRGGARGGGAARVVGSESVQCPQRLGVIAPPNLCRLNPNHIRVPSEAAERGPARASQPPGLRSKSKPVGRLGRCRQPCPQHAPPEPPAGAQHCAVHQS